MLSIPFYTIVVNVFVDVLPCGQEVRRTLPVSDDGTPLVSMLSVMTLNTLRENIIGMTVRQNWNTFCM